MKEAVLKEAAAEIAGIAARIRAIGERTTAALARADLRGRLALARALTSPRGLGWAVCGGRAGEFAARAGGVAGAESLAELVAVTSLRLRIEAVAVGHPELFKDDDTRALIDAVTSDRDLAAVRILRGMFARRGASETVSAIAPIAMELLAVRALIDENPFNDGSGWGVAVGRAPRSEPLFGLDTRLVTRWDRGEGAAYRIALPPGERAGIASRGSVLAFLEAIAVLRTNGRIMLQEIEGPDGRLRYAVLAPGMGFGSPVNDSPQDFVGAGRNTILGDSPYVRALAKAIADFGVPEGAELVLVGHSEGGAAVMNLAQDAAFCARYRVTHVVSVGAPIDFKICADPRTWVASITNQHDIVPTLDGMGAGNCFDLHPDWYVVDYTNPSHRFPQCHDIQVYLDDLRDDLHEEREHIERRLSAFHGPVTRCQAYRLWDRRQAPPGFPFLTVPSSQRHCEGSALVAFFAADADAAARLAGPGLGQLVRLGGRAVVTVSAYSYRAGSLGAHDEVSVGLLVHDPWRARPLKVWTELLAEADRRRSGVHVVARVVSTEEAARAGREVWGLPGLTGRVTVGRKRGRVAAAVHDHHGTPLLALAGRLGPGLPSPRMDQVLYSRLGEHPLRSHVEVDGHTTAHPLPPVRLRAGSSGHPVARLLRELGLDGATPLAALSVPRYRARLGAGTPLTND
ncbi:acetoacetate decarboxylase family protein [Nonomuraea sp. NPDC046570]|uniref:acetoacetate decarboxylase family protein n=1 Tax=Nonomuraea sp. NPDC046570 TaxID=3155255 RepID=UPI0033E34661